MDEIEKPKRMGSGQVDQANAEPTPADFKNVYEETGPVLAVGYTVGKSGTVTNLDMVQTDFTKDNSPAAKD